MKRNFYSDNVSGAAPEILRAIVESNADDTAPYGGDPYTQRLERRMAELFETEVDVYPVGTGTVANGLCAALLCAPYGGIYCADVSHLHASECGGAEFWSGGNARSVPLPTVDGQDPAGDAGRGDRGGQPPGRRRAGARGQPHPGHRGRHGLHGARGAGAGGRRPRQEPPGAHGRRPVRQRRRAARLHAGRAHLARRASTSSRSEPPRTGRSAPRPSSSSTARSPRRCATGAAAPGTSTRRCASCPPSSSPSWRTTSGSGTRAHANAMAARVRQGLADIPGVRFPAPDRDQLRAGRAPQARVGRPGRRRLQLLPPRRRRGTASSASPARGTPRSRPWTR